MRVSSNYRHFVANLQTAFRRVNLPVTDGKLTDGSDGVSHGILRVNLPGTEGKLTNGSKISIKGTRYHYPFLSLIGRTVCKFSLSSGRILPPKSRKYTDWTVCQFFPRSMVIQLPYDRLLVSCVSPIDNLRLPVNDVPRRRSTQLGPRSFCMLLTCMIEHLAFS